MSPFAPFRKNPPASPWQEAVSRFRQKAKQLDRKRRLWKFYFYAFIVLPIFAVMLAIKALKTYVRIKLQEIAVNTPLEQ